MRLALVSSVWALGIVSVAFVGCSRTHDRDVQSRAYEPSAAEQRRIDERRAEERKAEERKADERRAEERKAEDRRIEEQRRADEERRAEEQRRAEERRTAERRTDERVNDRRSRAIGGGPGEPAVRATPASAVATMAAARCDREVRCKHIGPKEKYRTRRDCVADQQRDSRDDLNADVCPGGIREKELNDCLQAIRDEDCGNPLDEITRLSACRSGSLCMGK